MAKVLGVGGVFFKAAEPEKLAHWYRDCLGIEIDSSYNGCSFLPEKMPEKSCTVWAPFKADTDYFQPSRQAYMINFIVDDLAQALTQVEAAGGKLVGEISKYDYGDFGWFTDPEGNKVELWQPL